MRAGKLRHRITIKEPGITYNECNEEVPGYLPFATVWASVEPLKGREYLEAKKDSVEISYLIRIRYIAGLREDMIVAYQDKELDIESILNIDEKNKEIHLMCKERK